MSVTLRATIGVSNPPPHSPRGASLRVGFSADDHKAILQYFNDPNPAFELADISSGTATLAYIICGAGRRLQGVAHFSEGKKNTQPFHLVYTLSKHERELFSDGFRMSSKVTHMALLTSEKIILEIPDKKERRPAVKRGWGRKAPEIVVIQPSKEDVKPNGSLILFEDGRSYEVPAHVVTTLQRIVSRYEVK